MSDVNRGESAGRILLVEDDPEAALYAIHVLGRRGRFDVTHTADPAAALRMAAAERWDLVMTDLDMPGMSGLELVEALRRVDPSLPVAVVTAHICADETVIALKRRADEFLTKPVGVDQLIATASALIGKGRAARAR